MKKIIVSILLGTIYSMNIVALNYKTINPINDSVTTISFKTNDTNEEENGIKGKLMIGAGVGYNFIKNNIRGWYNGTYADGGVETIGSSHSNPLYNLSADYGLGKKFSLGVAAGYQTCRFNRYYKSHNSPYHNADNGTYYDDWTRIYIGVRGDYYIIANKNISLYTGLKLGYNSYSKTSTAIDSIPHGISTYNREGRYGKPGNGSIQAHFGFSYYFKGIVGFNAEIGLGFGSPYIGLIGMTCKL